MRTIIFSFALFFLIGIITGLNSCKKDEPLTESDCKKNHTGDITIVNSRPFTVNVKLGSDNIAGEFTEIRSVHTNDSTIYQNIPIGVVDVYATDDTQNWLLVNNETVKQCENVRFFLFWW